MTAKAFAAADERSVAMQFELRSPPPEFLDDPYPYYRASHARHLPARVA